MRVMCLCVLQDAAGELVRGAAHLPAALFAIWQVSVLCYWIMVQRAEAEDAGAYLVNREGDDRHRGLCLC